MTRHRSLTVLAAMVATILVSGLAIGRWLDVGRGRTSSDGLMHVTVLDVGQGDAILIETPNGDDILVDGGPPNGQVVAGIERHLPPGDRDLELVILTHPDSDHVGGLPDVARRYQIERVLETGQRGESRADAAWFEAITEQGSERLKAAAGSDYTFGDVHLDIEWPVDRQSERGLSSNDGSIVLTLTYGKTSFFLTGDISSTVESRLAFLGSLSDVDVLKVPHHGSATSSSEELLNAVQPELAIMSLGRDNRFGHPHPAVSQRYRQRGITVLRTDQLGDVVLVSDGTTVHVDS